MVALDFRSMLAYDFRAMLALDFRAMLATDFRPMLANTPHVLYKTSNKTAPKASSNANADFFVYVSQKVITRSSGDFFVYVSQKEIPRSSGSGRCCEAAEGVLDSAAPRRSRRTPCRNGLNKKPAIPKAPFTKAHCLL